MKATRAPLILVPLVIAALIVGWTGWRSSHHHPIKASWNRYSEQLQDLANGTAPMRQPANARAWSTIEERAYRQWLHMVPPRGLEAYNAAWGRSFLVQKRGWDDIVASYEGSYASRRAAAARSGSDQLAIIEQSCAEEQAWQAATRTGTSKPVGCRMAAYVKAHPHVSSVVVTPSGTSSRATDQPGNQPIGSATTG